ncbi:MAG: putative Na+/H+ antiporter [Opitutaceae bacterium]
MRKIFFITLASLGFGALATAAEVLHSLPKPLESYADPAGGTLTEVLQYRATVEPFNVVALAIFVCAIAHTFFTAKFRHWAHVIEARHAAKPGKRPSQGGDSNDDGEVDEVSFGGQLLHFLGEVEAVFGIWAVVLAAAITWFKGWPAAVGYIAEHVSYTEPMFVVVVMALAATRPVLALAERAMRAIASFGGGTPGAWWLSILIVAPLLGSLITEPAAMTIGALLLARQFYELKPSGRLAYATIGLLFVNVSVGGTLTHFAAPPVIMVAKPWDWGLLHMLTHFGWRAIGGILVATALYYLMFRREIGELATRGKGSKVLAERPAAPVWITVVHLLFLAFTVWQAHHPVLFIAAFLFFIAFSQATAHHQSPLDLRAPILVGFFLAGLVVHGGLQSWWIQPVLGRLGEKPLFLGAMILTAVNDNAAITYLASLVPDFTDALKYAVVAGAVSGGGLTVIANAPNPAGQAILSRYFPEGVAPLKLATAALLPTFVMALWFIVI